MKRAMETVKNFFSNKTNIFISCFIILNTILTAHALLKTGHASYKVFFIILAAELIIEIGLVLAYKHLSLKQVPLAKKFLVAAIPLGLAFAFLLPPGHAPDEYMHIIRTYALTNGEIIVRANDDGSATTNLPTELSSYAGMTKDNGSYSSLLKIADVTIGEEIYQDDENYAATVNYNPLVYLPHTLGMLVGKLLHLPLLFILYLGRVFSLAVYLILVYFSIKLIPKFKNYLAFVALLPMSLQQAVTFSADSVTIGISLLTISYAIYLAYNTNIKKITPKRIITICVLIALLGVCKLVYFPLCLLFLSIPHQKFSSKKHKWIELVVAILITGTLALLWMKFQPGNPPLESDNDQLGYILSNPFRYILVILSTIFDYYTNFYIGSTFGMSLGLLHIPLPEIYLFIAFVIIMLSITRNNEKIDMGKNDRWYFWLSAIAIVGLIMTALYLSWTDYKSASVEGVQGRYFLPILPLIPFILYSKKRSKLEKQPFKPEHIFLFSVFFNVCALIYVFVYTL